MNKKHRHIISEIVRGSIAEEMGLEPGDAILSINGNEIEDIFDYQYYSMDSELNIVVESKDGEECLLEIEKDEDEELGIIFDNGLMDNYRSCHNKCIFCFIDQNPPGMRESLYFKDDDSELRCRMLNNRFAGEALKKVEKFYEAGITMNGQIVLCPGWNDGKELEFSISELMKYLPVLESVSVVPVGLTRFREGLEKLRAFTPEECGEVIDIIEKYQKIAYERSGLHFIHASDEFYIVAGRDLPESGRYDDYRQIDNGVGKARFIIDDFNDALERVRLNPELCAAIKPRTVSTVTGTLTTGMNEEFARRIEEAFPGVKVNVYTILNDFYGHGITVTGLLVGSDIINQLKGKDLGERLYLPETCLRSGSDEFLDDVRVPELEDALQCGVSIVKSSGRDFVYSMLGIRDL